MNKAPQVGMLVNYKPHFGGYAEAIITGVRNGIFCDLIQVKSGEEDSSHKNDLTLFAEADSKIAQLAHKVALTNKEYKEESKAYLDDVYINNHEKFEALDPLDSAAKTEKEWDDYTRRVDYR